MKTLFTLSRSIAIIIPLPRLVAAGDTDDRVVAVAVAP